MPLCLNTRGSCTAVFSPTSSAPSHWTCGIADAPNTFLPPCPFRGVLLHHGQSRRLRHIFRRQRLGRQDTRVVWNRAIRGTGNNERIAWKGAQVQADHIAFACRPACESRFVRSRTCSCYPHLQAPRGERHAAGHLREPARYRQGCAEDHG